MWNALIDGRARAVYGGKLAKEYAQVEKLRGLIRQFDSAGRFRHISASLIDAETEKVKAEASCVSDDPHIIALARVSKVRLLCSHDKQLHKDFKNPSVLKPRGNVYQMPNHEPLIDQHCNSRAKSTVPQHPSRRSRAAPRKKR